MDKIGAAHSLLNELQQRIDDLEAMGALIAAAHLAAAVDALSRELSLSRNESEAD